MAILNDTIGKGLKAAGLNLSRRVVVPDAFGQDFPEGLTLTEFIDGRFAAETYLPFIGQFMPHQPFPFGGKQRLVKEFYAGNNEPTIQVLGAEENDTTIKGCFKVKRIKDVTAKTLVVNYQEAVDEIRKRGNLLKITLGEWIRYGFMEEANFTLKRLTEIEYEIRFMIVGDRPPSNYKFANASDDDVVKPTAEVVDRAAAAFAEATAFPDEIPFSVADAITNAISNIATSVNVVTNFIEGVIREAQDITRASQRAIGLIQNARATISRSSREIGQIANTVSNLGSAFESEADKTVATIKVAGHIDKVQASNQSLARMLADLQKKFASLARTVPLVRHLVKEGDTLHKLSVQYYNDVQHWKKIYDHNKLTSTVLTRGTVIEIPKLGA